MDSLRNHFLIAMPSMTDPTFARTVTYICEHSDTGAMGLIINVPSNIELGYIYEQFDITCCNNSSEEQVLTGGPVQTERGFVLHSPPTEQPWQSTIQISEEVYLTTSDDIMTALANNTGPQYYLPIVGYAGWDSSQLEQEIANNDWLTVEADSQILFNKPYPERWAAAAQLLGVDINTLSNTCGHA